MPSCNRRDLTLDVIDIKYDDGEYTFTATLACPECQEHADRRRRFAFLRRLRRVKLGPSGVEVEVAGREE